MEAVPNSEVGGYLGKEKIRISLFFMPNSRTLVCNVMSRVKSPVIVLSFLHIWRLVLYLLRDLLYVLSESNGGLVLNRLLYLST